MKNRKANKKSSEPPKIIELSIDSLAAGGDGVGRVLGKVCFVPFCAPGDKIKAKVISENKKMLRAQLVEIISPGSGRQKPVCNHFEQCGGCHWMHLKYEVQLEAKAQILARALEMDEVQIIPSPNPLGYRTLAKLHLISRINKPPVFGFAKNKGREVVDIVNCPVLSKQLENCILPLKKGPLAHVNGRLEIKLSDSMDGPIVSFSSPVPLAVEVYQKFTHLVPEHLAGAVVKVDNLRSTIAGTSEVKTEGGKTKNNKKPAPLTVPAGSFGQANHQVNQILRETIAQWLKEYQFETAIELFAGAGNFSVAIGAHVKKLATAELDKEACKAARKNIDLRKIRGITVHNGDAANIYGQFGENCDLVVLDPPRIGNMDLAKELANGNHSAILYISCNPATLYRDLAPLFSKGYNLTKVVGFDMFPQTSHMEVAVLLTR